MSSFAEAIKEFNARLGDELSIKPGDKIEVISDDREFNDGWYMGKNLATNLAGLYPKSFTKPIPNPNTVVPQLHNKRSNDSSLLRSRSRNRHSLTSPLGSPISSAANNFPNNNTNTQPFGQSNPAISTGADSSRSSVSSTRISSPNINKYNSINSNTISNLINNNSNAKFNAYEEEEREPYYNNNDDHRGSHSSVVKTMSEIDQALQDFRPSDDTGYTSRPIIEWTSQDVADYFKSLSYHQEASQFAKHKITGNILLELELAYLKELDIGPFGTRFEIFKIIESLRTSVNNGNSFVSAPQPQQRKLSGTGIIHTSNTETYTPPHISKQQQQQQQPTQNYGAPANEYASALGDAYTMDNPYLNSSTDNFANHGLANQNYGPGDNYSSSSNSELVPNQDFQRSDSGLEGTLNDHRKSYAQKRASYINTGSGSLHSFGNGMPTNASNTTSPNLNNTHEDRQFSPVRKAPLPPGNVPSATLASTIHSPKGKKSTNDIFSSSSPSTPVSASRNGGSNSIKQSFVPFSAGSRIPDSPIMHVPEEDFGKLNLIDEHAEANNGFANDRSPPLSPLKYRSASANEAKSSGYSNGNINNAALGKRAVSSNDSGPKPSINPIDNGQSEGSTFKVTQVRNAQTSKTGKKTKKQTSAFQEGINHVTPEMALKTSEYSGWMSKKSSSAVGPWKQRFFTLHGTRLSYFGSMKDVKEKGLIDITAHRVLPAKEDDKLVSLYAATTGQGRYCFKLVPPAPGSKKGLTFTQPKVHYFAVETREEMRNWMVALMKATIDLDDTVPTVSTCSTPTVSLQKAQELLYKARENAKAREEQLKAKGFLQPGINNGSSINPIEGKLGSPDLNLGPVEPPLVNGHGNSVGANGASFENSSLSPAESSSLNSGQSHTQQLSQQTSSTSNAGTPKLSSLQEIQAAAAGLLSPKSPKLGGSGEDGFRNKTLNRFKKN